MPKLSGSVLGFFNTDDEVRLIPKGDYLDAKNIRRQISSGGIPTAVKNVLGNTLVSYSLPSGTNTCVGAVVHEETNNVFYFVHNTGLQHSILQYNTITNVITKVVQDSYLNFSKGKIVQGDAINAIDDSGLLLYWTDDYNPPRKINVRRAILHNQGDYSSGYAQEFSTGTNTQKDKFYDHVKHPPLDSPSFEFFTNTSRKYNKIRDGVWQFRYRYIYDDDEVSALSPWSSLAVSTGQLQNNANVAKEYTINNNGLRLTFNTAQNNVRNIEVTFRKGNTGDEFLLRRMGNSPLNSTTTIDFYNDEAYSLVAPNDSAKNYDGVPLLAKDFKIKEQRGFFANALDGYDNVDVTGNVGVSYNAESNLSSNQTITVSIRPTNLLEVDFSGLTSWSAGDTITVDFNLNGTYLSFSDPTDPNAVVTSYPFADIDYSFSYIIQGGDSKSDIVNSLSQNLSGYQDYGYIFSPQNITVNRINFRITQQGTLNVLPISNTTNHVFVLTDKSSVYEFGLSFNSFKSGVSHPVGVIYFDRAGRANTVSKLDETYVKWYTERNGGSEGYGATSLGIMINNVPPVWATHYQIVYAGNSSVDEFLQYTTVGAYRPSSGNPNADDQIYISLRNFQGEDKSFKESTRARPSYNFVDGDRLRIKSYWDYTLDTPSRVYPNGYLDFKIVGYELLAKDSTNPIYNNTSTTTQEQTSGYFLILENPKISGFQTSEARESDSSSPKNNFWYDYTAEAGAYFEIYRPKAQSEFKAYYEVSEKYSIANPRLSTRYHEGGVRNQNETVSVAAIPPETADQFFNYVDINTSTNKFVAGDIIECTDGGALMGIFTVVRVLNQGTSIRLYIDGALSNNDATAIDTVTLQSVGAATEVTKGDVWYKPRAFFEGNVNALVSSFLIANVWVEDYYANDFIDSNSWSKGRVWAYSPDNQQIRRKASIYHSEKFFSDTNFNGLSSFNLALTPYRDFDQSFGGIQAMRNHNEGLIVWQENKTSLIPVDRRIIESTEGGDIQTVSDTVLNEQRFYRGDYGIGLNPESLNGADGVWYWIDLKRGKYLRLSNDGITPVSDYKMRGYFYTKGKLYYENYGGAKFFGGYDREFQESVITFPIVTTSTVTVSDTPITTPLPNTTTTTGDMIIGVDIKQGVPNKLTVGNETRRVSEISESVSEMGGPKYTTSEIADKGFVEVPYDVLNSTTTTADMYLTMQTTTGDVITKGVLDISKSEIQVPLTSDFLASPIAVTPSTAGEVATVAFYEPANRWSTEYDRHPEFYATISNFMLTWKNGALYVENSNQTRNNFYGVQYTSRVIPVINDAPYEVKFFNAASMEANSTWDVVYTTDLNAASADETLWVDKEGTYHMAIPRVYSGSTNSQVFGLSDVLGVTGNTIAVVSGTLGGIFVGDTIYASGSSVGSITAVDYSTNVLTLSSVSGLIAGSYVYVQREVQVEGDVLRGNYVQMDLTNNDTAEAELFTVDVEAKKSYV